MTSSSVPRRKPEGFAFKVAYPDPVELGQENLAEGDIPIARLVPVGSRIAGLHAGTIWTSVDFDEPLAVDVLW
jgi:hypothetical protein